MYIKKILLPILIYFFFICSSVNSQENKILFNINNEIITSIDILNEINYLNALNDNFKKTEKSQAFEIAKNSLIREKVKEIELKKFFKEINLEKNQLNTFLINYFNSNQINNMNDLSKFFEEKNLELEFVKKKFTIEIMWNRLIYLKFNKKVKIDEEKIKKEISEKKSQKEYFLYEILFSIDDGEKLDEKYNLIKDTISKEGFSKAALLYSISNTSKNDGQLGWIKESSINENILDELEKIEIRNFTKPIIIPGGFLILKIDETREINEVVDLEREIQIIIKNKTNQQLNQFSNIYFNKIKKNLLINEL